MYLHFHDTELYELGMVVHQAFNDPKELKKLEPKRRAAEFDIADLPGMLRIPRKKTRVENGG